MRVLHILNEIRPSGAEVMLALAAPFWIGEGCELAAIATGNSPGEFADYLGTRGFVIGHCTSKGCLDGSFQKLIAAIKRHNPDVVHVHTENNSAVMVTSIAAAGFPVLRTIHNSFPYAGGLRIRKICERFVERRSAFCQISISKSVFDNELHRLKNRTELCWNWFNDAHFRPPTPEERCKARNDLGLRDDEVVLVSVGNGNDVKNYPSIIEALALLRKRDAIKGRVSGTGSSSSDSLSCSSVAAHIPLTYLMVGNEHPHKIERETAARLGVSESVRFCGPRTDIRKYLWAADIFVMPSRYEGFGLSAVEAMATGMRCIFSDCPGLRDFRSFPVEVTWCGTAPESISQSICGELRKDTFRIPNEKSAQIARNEFGVVRRSNEYLRLWRKAFRSRKR